MLVTPISAELLPPRAGTVLSPGPHTQTFEGQGPLPAPTPAWCKMLSRKHSLTSCPEKFINHSHCPSHRPKCEARKQRPSGYDCNAPTKKWPKKPQSAELNKSPYQIYQELVSLKSMSWVTQIRLREKWEKISMETILVSAHLWLLNYPRDAGVWGPRVGHVWAGCPWAALVGRENGPSLLLMREQKRGMNLSAIANPSAVYMVHVCRTNDVRADVSYHSEDKNDLTILLAISRSSPVLPRECILYHVSLY